MLGAWWSRAGPDCAGLACAITQATGTQHSLDMAPLPPWNCISSGLLFSTCCCLSFCRPTHTPPADRPAD